MLDKRGRFISKDSRSKMGGSTRFKPKHGLRNTVEYRLWQDMLNRCRNPKVKSYKNYGARGIKVCERWNEFINFYYDMGKRPTPNHSIERINVNKDYEPGNVVWILKSFQQRNTTKTRYITYQNKTMTVIDWANKLGIKEDTLYKRVFIYKWSVERAILEHVHF